MFINIFNVIQFLIFVSSLRLFIIKKHIWRGHTWRCRDFCWYKRYNGLESNIQGMHRTAKTAHIFSIQGLNEDKKMVMNRQPKKRRVYLYIIFVKQLNMRMSRIHRINNGEAPTFHLYSYNIIIFFSQTRITLREYHN